MKPRRFKAPDPTALLAAIVDSSDDAIVSKTLEGIITSWNRGAEQIFGYTSAEAVGQHITLIIPRERHGEEETVLTNIRQGNKIDHFETVRQTKDGRRIDISLTVSPVRDAQGQIVGASKVARDITARKRAEAERAQIAEREQAARRIAEQANLMKDEFLATVSHELRNPLNSIVGWAALLKSGNVGTNSHARAVEAILKAAHAQAQIISDLLDVSRIISGKMRLDIRPFELVEVLQDAIDTVRPAADAKQIRVHTLFDPGASPMAGDPDRLRQVFWNLLSNAVKFTPSNGRVQVVSQRINSHIEITVNDTGTGIEPELLPFVFERFRQGDSGPNRRTMGLGLGLAIARHLVELHGGSVRAQSDGLGQGATFIVRLPVMIAPLSESAKERIHPRVDEILPFDPGTSLTNVKVLVVDDEAGAREIVTAILVQAQAEVRTAESADQALAVMEEWTPDVLVADIGMPGVDGYELIRRVRARGPRNGRNIPAAALTAFARAQDRLRVLSAGYQTHIPKPVQPAELVTVVVSLAKGLN
jgi:PAS domain S-box-containing protein